MESGSPKEIAARLVAARGWSDAQYQCLVTMWTRESSWNHHAVNAGSGAYGIPQALPGSKMAAYGSDWRDNPTTQIKWGLAYIESRYNTPCGAWSWWQAHNWY
nr:phage tail tip lysozyme [Actinopolymorpha cephalotaxi]